MKKLFIFQNNALNEYYNELECLFNICRKSNLNLTQGVQLNDVSADYLVDNSIQVVISNGLPKEWYLITKGLKIVTITLDNLEKYKDYSDIVIDFKSKDNNIYFTGRDYSICNNKDMEADFLEIINLIVKMDWDSDFWGHNVAFLSSRHLTENIIFNINKFIKKENIKLIEYLCNCHDNRSVIIAEQNGFHFTDIRLSFEKVLKEKKEIKLDNRIIFNRANEKDIPILKEISFDLYKDSRYFFDMNFDLKRAREFYQGWVEKAVKGTFDDECYCLYEHDKPIGFCTIKYGILDSVSIGLFGLSKEYQRKGLSQKLLDLVFNELINKKISKVTVITQGRNYLAQRLYQKAGFLTRSTELWYHKWI